MLRIGVVEVITHGHLQNCTQCGYAIPAGTKAVGDLGFTLRHLQDCGPRLELGLAPSPDDDSTDGLYPLEGVEACET